jgi:hypothetical protein
LPANLNVILLTVDTLRFDLGFTGYSRPTSPNIDRLAARSVVFERGYSLASYTGKSAADATPFDMRGVDLSHHGDDCSFETFLRRYRLDDAALDRLAEIVHEADLGDERFDAPEGPGLDAVIRGLSLVADDDRILELTRPLFDGLYRRAGGKRPLHVG